MMYMCVHMCVYGCVCMWVYALNHLGLGIWKPEVNMISDDFFNLSPLYNLSLNHEFIISTDWPGSPQDLASICFLRAELIDVCRCACLFCECPGLLRPSCFLGKCLVQVMNLTTPNSLILLLLFLKKWIGEHFSLEIMKIQQMIVIFFTFIFPRLN